MTPLAAKLLARIARSGPLSVAQYMEACLGDPEFGYYTTRDPLGWAGDFTTAPEISQMFGELVGLWAAVVWQSMGAPSDFQLVELGPGRGTLMADALRACKGAPGFLEAARLNFVEASPVLRDKQAGAVAASGLTADPVWWRDASQVPAGPAVVVANEFLDALPIRQYEMTDQGWRERLVAADGDGFRFVLADTPPPAFGLPGELPDAEPGDLFEVSPPALRCIHTLAARFADAPGAALFVDYGHVAHGFGDTLQAVGGHEYRDVFDRPGEHDLTTHVDFAACAWTARQAGAAAHGPVTQATLLERLGISARAAALLRVATPDQGVDIATAKRRLTSDEGMGRLFKALCIASPGLPTPPGFEAATWE